MHGEIYMPKNTSRSRSSGIGLRGNLLCPAAVEENSPFFDLFPHRFDYIYAEHSAPGRSPDWQTERRYPLSDRLLHQGSFLYGVRFGAQTRYCMLDIDSSSIYHPHRDPLAIARIQSALEAIGLVSSMLCTSSYSGGLHLYLPFPGSATSWELGNVISLLLENAGFKLSPGQLEVFPNRKLYRAEATLSLFNAHRLPMQAGSYLLNEDFQPIWGDRDQFVQQWQLIQNRNQIDRSVFRRLLKQTRQNGYPVSGKADKFLSDLNTEIELGWTGFGQTNRLLGRIAMRSYIFHHILTGEAPLAGEPLIQEIVKIAQVLPGYSDWCRHQSDIYERAEEWARCVESSCYFHYGSSKGKYKSMGQTTSDSPAAERTEAEQQMTWNQRQAESARSRIREAIAELLNQGELPTGATARFRQLTQFGIGGASLYRHRDLWHPDCLMPVESPPVANSELLRAPVEIPPDPPNALEEERMGFRSDESHRIYPTSLFPEIGGNVSSGETSREIEPSVFHTLGGNTGDSLGIDCEVCVEFAPLSTDRLSSYRQFDEVDLSDLLMIISIYLRQLDLTVEQVRDRLLILFGKSRRSQLTRTELLQWLNWLEATLSQKLRPRISESSPQRSPI